MNKAVLTANTQPNSATASGLALYCPISAVGNGMKDWPIRKIELIQTKA
jgi:hypothetical protein